MKTYYIPEVILSTLFEIAESENEHSGFLFVDPRTNKVIGFYDVTRLSNEGFVEPDKNKVRLVEEIKKKVSLETIEYHIHSYGTIERYGEYYLTEPSDADLENIVENLNKDPNYKHLLISKGYSRREGRVVQYLKPLTANFEVKSYKATKEDLETIKLLIKAIEDVESEHNIH